MLDPLLYPPLPRRRALELSADIDLAEPSAQVLPSSVAAAQAICGRTFTEVWPSFAAASGNIASSGANALVPLVAPRYAKTFPVWDGSSMLGMKAIELQGSGTTNYVTLLDAGAYDLDESLCWVFYGRLLRTPAADRSLLGKRGSSTGAGYEVRVTSGRPQLRVGNGTTSATIEPPEDGSAEVDGFANGSPQWWAFKMDLATGNATVFGYRAAGTPVAMPSGSKVSASAFRVGGLPYLFSCELFQVAWLGVLTGAEAEAFTVDNLNALDTTARPPAVFESYSRRSCISPRIGYEAGFGVRVQHLHGSAVTTGLVHAAHLYHPSATVGAAGLAYYPTRGASVDGFNKRNMLTWSGEIDNAAWTKSNVTVVANAAEDPSGFTGAASLTASAANAIISRTLTVTANKAHYFSVYVRRVGGSDVALKLRGVDVNAAATIAEYDKTATSEWTRIACAVQDADATSIRFELEIVANGAAIYAAFAQVERGFLSEYQAQRGTLVDRAATHARIANAGRLDPRRGKVEVTAVSYIDNAEALEDQYVFSTDVAGGVVNGGRVLLQISDPNGFGGGGGDVDEPYNTDFQVYDSTGTLAAHVGNYDLDRDAELTYAVQWDSSGLAVPDADAPASLGQTGSATSTEGPVVPTGSWSMPVTVPYLYVGARYTFGDPYTQSTHFEGGIERVRIWR